MAKLFMISGDRSLAEGKHGAFYNTLEEFHKYWERVDIICPKVSRGSTSGGFEIEPLFGNVYIHPSPWPLIMQPWWILKKGMEVYREYKFDLMTVHEYPPFYNGIGARLLWNKIRVSYVIEIHHVPGYPRVANLKEWFYKLVTRCFIKYDTAKARVVRVVNQHQVPEFLIRAGVPESKIVYIPSMYINLDVFKPIEVEKKYDLVFAARLEKNKGILNLIEAVRIVKISRSDIKLLIIGQGTELNRIKLLATRHSLLTNIFFSGWLETPNDVAVAYNSARIFINPSLNEGGPRVALEAMACGVPVITTPVGIMCDVIRDGENGLFTDWESERMADIILSLLDSHKLQNKFSQVGLELVKQFEKKSAIQNFAEKLQGLITEV